MPGSDLYNALYFSNPAGGNVWSRYMNDCGRPKADKRGLSLFMDAVLGSNVGNQSLASPTAASVAVASSLGPAIPSRMPSDGWLGTRQEQQGSPSVSGFGPVYDEFHIVNGKTEAIYCTFFQTSLIPTRSGQVACSTRRRRPG